MSNQRAQRWVKRIELNSERASSISDLKTRESLRLGIFPLTQEFLSTMLGVRRAGVSTAAMALQKAKLIFYKRGIITILDRKGLETAYERLFSASTGLEGALSLGPIAHALGVGDQNADRTAHTRNGH